MLRTCTGKDVQSMNWPTCRQMGSFSGQKDGDQAGSDPTGSRGAEVNRSTSPVCGRTAGHEMCRARPLLAGRWFMRSRHALSRSWTCPTPPSLHTVSPSGRLGSRHESPLAERDQPQPRDGAPSVLLEARRDRGEIREFSLKAAQDSGDHIDAHVAGHSRVVPGEPGFRRDPD